MGEEEAVAVSVPVVVPVEDWEEVVEEEEVEDTVAEAVGVEAEVAEMVEVEEEVRVARTVRLRDWVVRTVRVRWGERETVSRGVVVRVGAPLLENVLLREAVAGGEGTKVGVGVGEPTPDTLTDKLPLGDCVREALPVLEGVTLELRLRVGEEDRDGVALGLGDKVGKAEEVGTATNARVTLTEEDGEGERM